MDSETLISQFGLFLEQNEGRSPRTSTKYTGYIKQLLVFLEDKQLTLGQVKTETLEEFSGIYLHQRGMRPRSRRSVVAAVKKFYKWLRRRKVLKSDPSLNLSYPSAGKALPVPIEPHNYEKLIMAPGMNTLIGRRDTAIIALMGGCGLRVSGIASMNESNLIFYQDQGKERLAVRVREKGDKERIVPAPDECWALVRAYLGSPELDDIDRTLSDGDQVLFVSTMNRNVPPAEYHGEKRRLARGSMWEMIRKYGKRLGIPDKELRPHAMRHMYGTQLAEHGVDPRDRQALMGHADISSTMIYTHLAKNRLAGIIHKQGPFKNIKTPVSSLIQQLQ